MTTQAKRTTSHRYPLSLRAAKRRGNLLVECCDIHQEIATAYGLAMTVVDDGWNFYFACAVDDGWSAGGSAARPTGAVRI